MSVVVRLTIIVLTFLALFFEDAVKVGTIELYLYAFLILYDVYETRGIRLLQVWILSFIYVIVSDILINHPTELWSTRYLVTANNFVLLSYMLTKPRKEREVEKFATENVIRNRKSVRLFIIIAYAIYILSFIGEAIRAFNFGRADSWKEQGSLSQTEFLTTILSSLGLILPSIIAFYYKNLNVESAKLKSFLVSLPVFLILIMLGSRFPLLFSAVGYMLCAEVITLNGMTRRQMWTVAIIAFLVMQVSSFMKTNRVAGRNDNPFQSEQLINEDSPFAVRLADHMSSEGIIDMMNKSHEYFQNNEYTYGASAGFIFYFWVPRMFWPDKPTQLGYWLPRKFLHNLSIWHSASFGFPGEFYADFGLFSLLFTVLFGFMLKRLEGFASESLQSNRPQRIMAGMLFPFVFFFVRSPITATTILIGILIFYYVFKAVLKQRGDDELEQLSELELQ